MSIQVSTAASGRTLEADGLRITSEFPGGAGGGLQSAGSGQVRLTIPPDPDCRGLPGYDYRFCVRIENIGAARTVKLEARMPGDTADVAWCPSRVPLFAGSDGRTWFVLDDVEAAPTHREFRITLPMESGETLYCTNSLPCPSADMLAWIERLAEGRGQRLSVESVGITTLGRPIPVGIVTDRDVPEADKDRVLITSGFHPAEPDWLASMELIDVLSGDSAWAAAMRRAYVFDIVPQVNPDGFDLGSNASNAHGVNMYWDFRRDDEATSPEAVALWRWVSARPPDLFIDYHAYVYQLEKDYRPYIRPASEYPAAARGAVRAMDRAIVDLCGGRGVRGAATSDPRSLAPQLTSHFGTLTYPKFHLHLYHGIDGCRRLGVEVTRALLTAAEPHRPLRAKTGRSAWHPGAVDRAVTALQHSGLAVKAHNAWRRASRRLAGRPVMEGVRLDAAPGLPPHWRAHLWRNRAGAGTSPVWSLDRTAAVRSR